jgi:hypothetical protein
MAAIIHISSIMGDSPMNQIVEIGKPFLAKRDRLYIAM